MEHKFLLNIRQAEKSWGDNQEDRLWHRRLVVIRLVFPFQTLLPFTPARLNLHLIVERNHSTSRLLSTTALRHWALLTSQHWRAWPAFEKLSPMLCKGFCLNSTDSYIKRKENGRRFYHILLFSLSLVHFSFAVADGFLLCKICLKTKVHLRVHGNFFLKLKFKASLKINQASSVWVEYF